MFFFDMKDASEIPAIAEPLFVHARRDRSNSQPAMNGEDLKKGLAAAVCCHVNAKMASPRRLIRAAALLHFARLVNESSHRIDAVEVY